MSKKTAERVGEITAAESRRFSMLRIQLLDCHPFWGHLLLQMRLVPAPDLDALAATDCVRHIRDAGVDHHRPGGHNRAGRGTPWRL
jgi:hypothetical protein